MRNHARNIVQTGGEKMCYYPDYGCERHFHHGLYRGWGHHHGWCCGPEHMPRQFRTKDEIIQDLEEYLK